MISEITLLLSYFHFIRIHQICYQNFEIMSSQLGLTGLHHYSFNVPVDVPSQCNSTLHVFLLSAAPHQASKLLQDHFGLSRCSAYPFLRVPRCSKPTLAHSDTFNAVLIVRWSRNNFPEFYRKFRSILGLKFIFRKLYSVPCFRIEFFVSVMIPVSNCCN